MTPPATDNEVEEEWCSLPADSQHFGSLGGCLLANRGSCELDRDIWLRYSSTTISAEPQYGELALISS